MLPNRLIKTLRYAYRAAAAQVRSEGKKVTMRALADEIGTSFSAVQSFLHRNEALKNEIGLEIEHYTHSVQEYAEAIRSIPPNVRPSHRLIGAAVNVVPSCVGRFLQNHPELKSLHPRFGDKRRKDLDENGDIIRKPPRPRNRKKAISESIVTPATLPVAPPAPAVTPKAHRAAPRAEQPRKMMRFGDTRGRPKNVPTLPIFVPEPRESHVEPHVVEQKTATQERWWRDLYVSVWDEDISRYAGKGVTRSEYLAYWTKKLLKHQREGKPKPDNLPTPEEVAFMR